MNKTNTNEDAPIFATPITRVIDAASSSKDYRFTKNVVLLELLEFATEASRPLINGIFARDLPLPVVDFELPTSSKGCGPEPELAWPNYKIAVLAERQVEDRNAFISAGWTIFLQPITETEISAALKQALANAATKGSPE